MEEAADFTPVEQAVVRHAVEDWAAVYYGGPLNFGETSAVRYVTEGHLEALCTRHGRDAVWKAVQDRVAADRSVLELTPEQRQERQTARQEEAARLLKEARWAYDSGEYRRSLLLIDHAELADPAYEPSPGVPYERIRQEVRSVLRRVFGLDSPGADSERDAEGEFVAHFQSAVDALVRSGDLVAEPSSGVLRITPKGRRRLAEPDAGGGESEM